MSTKPEFQNHLLFITFHSVFVFDNISQGMLVTLEKELGEYFQRLLFLNQWVPLIKMYYRVRYLFDLDLKIRSGQVWQGLHSEELKKIYEYVAFYAKLLRLFMM